MWVSVIWFSLGLLVVRGGLEGLGVLGGFKGFGDFVEVMSTGGI